MNTKWTCRQDIRYIIMYSESVEGKKADFIFVIALFLFDYVNSGYKEIWIKEKWLALFNIINYDRDLELNCNVCLCVTVLLLALRGALMELIDWYQSSFVRQTNWKKIILRGSISIMLSSISEVLNTQINS